jgi:hypothetical protein
MMDTMENLIEYKSQTLVAMEKWIEF